MRISFSSLACPGWTVEDIAAAARRYGYDGVEWRLADGALLGPQTDEDVWRRIATCGVHAVCLDTSCTFVTANDDERRTTIADAIAMGERASAIGAPFIRVFGGGLPQGAAREAIVTATRDALASAADGMPAGVMLLIETHDAWSRGSDIAGLVAGIDGVGVLWDVAHTTRAGEGVGETMSSIGVPGLVHVKDAVGDELTHIGEGRVPLAEAVGALAAAGYDGWLSLEWEKLWHPELDDADVALPRAGAALRDLVTQASV